MKKLLHPAIVWATVSSILVPLYAYIGKAIYYDAAVFYDFCFKLTSLGRLFNVDTCLIYPSGAIVPVMLAGVIGLLFGEYLTGWMILVAVLNFATMLTVGVKYNFGHKAMMVATGGSVLMTGIFFYRLDIVAVFLTVIAVAVFDKHKQLAYFLLVFGVFVKIWPIAVIVAIWLLSNEKIKDIIKVAAYATVFLAPMIVLGGVEKTFKFITMQGERGIQIESLYAIPLFLAGNQAEFSDYSLTNEITGSGAGAMIMFSDSIIIILLVIAGILGFTKYWRTPATLKEAFLVASIIIVSFIVFNKVGSTQFSVWLLLALLLIFVYVKPDKMWYYTAFVLCSMAMSGLNPYYSKEMMDGEFTPIFYSMLKNATMLILVGMLIVEYVRTVFGKKNELVEKIL